MAFILGLPQLTEYGPQAHKTRMVMMPGLWGSAAHTAPTVTTLTSLRY